MEQARYWMWAKAKPDPRILSTAMGDSWEEQAFAEDAANTLGGCVWPPRSYSCSFCRREFRSAQALGGHMNVHRRDRARLKQSPAEVVVPRDHALNACTFLYSNPNPEFRVSPSPEERMSNLSFFVKKNDHVVSVHDPPPWSSFLSEKRDRSTKEDEKKSEKEDCVTEDLSKSLNLVACQKRKKATSSDDDEEVASCKRRKIEAEPERCVLAMDSGDELDLELRLGNAPKVK